MSSVAQKKLEDEKRIQHAMDKGLGADPSTVKSYLDKAAPVLEVLGKVVNFLGPYFEKAYALGERGYEIVKPYHPEETLPMFLGLLMMLFGGYFMMFIACVEAYRISGWDHTKEHLYVLYQTWIKVRDANKKDDQEDLDHDGVADVNEISKEQLLTRKITLFMRTADPVAVSNALSGLYTGFIAVIATLKMRFVRTIALGAAVGEVINRTALKLLGPPLRQIIPKDYHKWIDIGIAYASKFIGVSIMMTLQRAASAIHSAFRGAQIFTDAFAVYTARLGYTQLAQGYWDEAVSAIVAVVGVTSQLRNFFVMPWIMSILLFPLLLAEKFLEWVVTYDVL